MGRQRMSDLIAQAFSAWDQKTLPAQLAVALGDVALRAPWRSGASGFTKRDRAQIEKDFRHLIDEQTGYDKFETADDVADAIRVADPRLTTALFHLLAVTTGSEIEEGSWKDPAVWP